jgi:antitoxin YefM
MEVVSYTHLRNNLTSVLDKVHENHNPVLITRQKGTPAILISLEDYNSFEETAYLMRSPENAKRINRSIEALEKGMGVVHELIEVK